MPGESWSFTQQGGAGGGEVSPGSGSTGFSSRAFVVANSSGQLVASSNVHYDSTQGFVGIGTTAPAAPLDVASTLGIIVSTGTGGIVWRGGGGRISASSTEGLQIRAQSVGNPKVAISASGMNVQTTVNGNAFQVNATTGGVNVAFNVKSSGTTSKIGFWTTVGSTRSAAYTTAAATTVRTLPTTITTVAGLMSAPEREEFNKMAGVLAAWLGKDARNYGLTG